MPELRRQPPVDLLQNRRVHNTVTTPRSIRKHSAKLTRNRFPIGPAAARSALPNRIARIGAGPHRRALRGSLRSAPRSASVSGEPLRNLKGSSSPAAVREKRRRSRGVSQSRAECGLRQACLRSAAPWRRGTSLQLASWCPKVGGSCGRRPAARRSGAIEGITRRDCACGVHAVKVIAERRLSRGEPLRAAASESHHPSAEE
jgi:hypothetical protein